MEASFLSPFSLLAITLVAIVLIKVLVAVYCQLTYWKRKGIPYVSSVPFLGTSWKVMLGINTIIDHFEYLYKSLPNARYYGKMNIYTPNIVIRDPELIKELGVKNFKHFPDHRMIIDERIEPMFTKNLFTLRGDRWREMRNVLSPSFSTKKMSFMFDLVAKCSLDFVDYLYQHSETISSVEMKDTFRRYTNDVIATAAFGLEMNSLRNPDNEFYTKAQTFFQNRVQSMWKVFIMRTSTRLSKWLGIRLFPPESVNYFRNAISDTLKARDEQGVVRPDMIQLLKIARDTEKLSNQPTTEDIVSQAFIFFLAGLDTTSTLLSIIAYEIALHPDVQKKIHEEVDCYMKEGNGEISYDALAKMEYIDQVVSETLRLHPAVLAIDRLCVEEFELPPAAPGYKSVTVSPGEVVLFPAYGLHRDPKYFPDPEKFDPERFGKENKDNIDPYVYMPFGIGPRKCIGNRFALMKIKILLIHLFHKFVVKPTEKTQVPLTYQSYTFQAVVKGGVWLGLEKRIP